jgi:hypothetical protein
MVKATKGLQILYPRMVHLTCLAHALHWQVDSKCQENVR